MIGQLHLYDKAGAVGVRAFHIDTDSLAVRKRVDVRLRSVFQRNDRAFGNEFLEEEGEQPLPSFRAERALEPVVKQDAGYRPCDFVEVMAVFHKHREKAV